MKRAASFASLLLLVVGAFGHDRPTAAERVPVPLVPTQLPSGYVLSRIDERSAGSDGRWFDLSFAPVASKSTDASGVISLHQRLDVEPDLTFLADGGEAASVGGRRAVCGNDGILRWAEKRTALMSVGGGDMSCADLRKIAESMVEVDAQTWSEYERSGRDQ